MYTDFIEKVSAFEPLFLSNYQFASAAWHLKKRPYYKLYGMSRKDYYDSLPESKPQGEYFFLATEKHRELPEWVKAEYPISERVLEDGEFLLLKLSRK